MKKDGTIVCVSASYCDRENLMTLLKKYSQHSDERFAYWDEFAFTAEPLPECDALLVFNTPFENIRTNCYPERVIAFMMEPGHQYWHPWMFKGLNQYYRVYSPISGPDNSIASHGYLGWYFHHDYHFLSALAVPEKPRTISCIASGLDSLAGHRVRLNFVNRLRKEIPGIDFFGKGNHFLPDKMDGLLPYRYSIAIENTSTQDYFTEKINDCFLAYTVPVYYGCKNISRYFPVKSFISIDINDPGKAIQKISEILSADDWSERLEQVKEARELVLNKYQPLAGAAQAFRQIRIQGDRKMISLNPVKTGVLRKIRRSLDRLLNNQ